MGVQLFFLSVSFEPLGIYYDNNNIKSCTQYLEIKLHIPQLIALKVQQTRKNSDKTYMPDLAPVGARDQRNGYLSKRT